jgi:peptidoglycan/LPS O-acetylase OafA/YrhL
MKSRSKPKHPIPAAPARPRDNNFGFLRVFFSALVIVSHSSHMLDHGGYTHEPLWRIFHTQTLGDLAVDGFFLISGYLVTKSFMQTKSLASFLAKRVLRIYPAYLLAFWASILIILPYATAQNPVLTWPVLLHQLGRWPLLLEPDPPMNGLPFTELNLSMWTLGYEFRLYLMVAFLGLIGAFAARWRAAVPAGAALLLALHVAAVGTATADADPVTMNFLRLGGIFGFGMSFHLFRENIRLTNKGALIAAALLFALCFSLRLIDPAVGICGGYIVFWFARTCPVLRLSRFTNQTDISYGLYLYACPVQILLIATNPTINCWLLTVLTLPLAGLLGLISWTALEKPALAFAHRFHAKPAPALKRK